MLEALDNHLCQTFGFDPTEPPLMRCDSLQPKFAQLLSDYASAAPVIGSRTPMLPRRDPSLKSCAYTGNAPLLARTQHNKKHSNSG